MSPRDVVRVDYSVALRSAKATINRAGGLALAENIVQNLMILIYKEDMGIPRDTYDPAEWSRLKHLVAGRTEKAVHLRGRASSMIEDMLRAHELTAFEVKFKNARDELRVNILYGITHSLVSVQQITTERACEVSDAVLTYRQGIAEQQSGTSTKSRGMEEHQDFLREYDQAPEAGQRRRE